MTRRPKLSLSAANIVDKKQPQGFETVIRPEKPQKPDKRVNPTKPKTTPSAAMPRGAPEAPPPKVTKTRSPMATVSRATTPQVTTNGPSRKQVVKVILVVVAAALSLYLLKRRLR